MNYGKRNFEKDDFEKKHISSENVFCKIRINQKQRKFQEESSQKEKTDADFWY